MSELIEKLRDPGKYVIDVKDSIKMCNDAAAEIERLRAAILMAENRLEAAHTGNDEVCRACIDVARSYLQTALKDKP